jgi:hypothetical protein
MWPFKELVPKVDEEREALCKRLKAAEAFAPVGSFIEYLGVKMMVVSHHDLVFLLYGQSFYVPGLKLEWMDSMQRLQRAFMRDCEFPLCKVISTPENKESAATIAQQPHAVKGETPTLPKR